MPVVVIGETNATGFWVLVHSDDLPLVAESVVEPEPVEDLKNEWLVSE